MGINPETGGANPKVLIQPAGQPPEVLRIKDLLVQWTGQVIFFTSRPVLAALTEIRSWMFAEIVFATLCSEGVSWLVV